MNEILIYGFWLKVLFAFFLAAGGLSGMMYRIYDLHQPARTPKLTLPDTTGLVQNLNPSVKALRPQPIPIVPSKCAILNFLGRLEPPDGKQYVGFHLDWALDLPLNISNRLQGKVPSIM